MSVKENMIFDSNGSRFKIFKIIIQTALKFIEKYQKMIEFCRIGYKLSSCLELVNWIVGFSLESDPEMV